MENQEFVIYAGDSLIEFIEEQKEGTEGVKDRAYIDYDKIKISNFCTKGYIAVRFVNYARSLTHDWRVFDFGRRYESWLAEKGYEHCRLTTHKSSLKSRIEKEADKVFKEDIENDMEEGGFTEMDDYTGGGI